MDFLNSLLDSSEVPLFTAFILGLLTALSPCPLATNITAIGFISKNIENKNIVFLQGLLYAFGRIITYTSLGAVLIYMLRQGVDTFDLQESVSYWGELLIAPFLIAFGLLMLFGDKLPLSNFGFSSNEKAEKLKGFWGSFLLGILFALAFCPSSGLFYFGMLIPMSAFEAEGYLLPAVYALATALPVLIVALIIAYGISNLAAFYSKIKFFQLWFSRIVALLFIIIGLYYAYIIY